MEMERRKKLLAKNTIILALGNICTKGIMFIMTPLLTRWLPTEDYGAFDLMTTYVSLVIPLVTLDIGEAAFRFLLDCKCDEERNTIIGNTTKIYILGIPIIGVLLAFATVLFPNKKYYIFLFMIIFGGELVYEYFTMLLRGVKKLNIYAMASIIYVFVMAVSAFIYIKVLDWQLAGIIIAYVTGYFFSIIYMGVAGDLFDHLFQSKLDLKIIKRFLAYSVPLLPNALSWWVVNVSDRTIISAVLGTSYNAVYAIACKIPNLAQSLFGVFHLSWIQSASESVGDTDRDAFYNDIMNKVVKIVCSLVSCMLATNFIFFEFIFPVEYRMGYYLVPILSLAIIFSMLAQFLGGIYIAKKNTKKNGITTSVAAIANITSHLLMIRFTGIYAAALSTLLSYVVLFIARILDIQKKNKLYFERKNLVILFFLVYQVAVSYLNLLWLNYVDLLLTCLFIIWCNRDFSQKIVRKIIMKLGDGI